MLCILGNSIILTLNDYSDRDSKEQYNRNLDVGGNIFTAIFIMEAILKVLAHGFVMHRFAYLRDPWNLVDLTIVITG